MSVKQYIPAIKYGNAVTSDEVDLSGITSSGAGANDITFTAGSPSAGTASVITLNPALVQTKTVSLTSAQILAMYATPVQLVTTTAAGQAIIVESCFFEVLNTSTTYTAGGAVIVGWNGSTASASGVLLSTLPSTIFSSTSAGYYLQNASTTSSGALVVQANSGVTIGNQTAAFATGTGTMKVFVNYYVITL